MGQRELSQVLTMQRGLFLQQQLLLFEHHAKNMQLPTPGSTPFLNPQA